MSTMLDGRSVVVTGAGRGIGAAMARALAAAGGRLAVADFDRAHAEAVAKAGAFNLEIRVDRLQLLGERRELTVPTKRVAREIGEGENELASAGRICRGE